MTGPLVELIRSQSRRLEPRPTGEPPRLAALPGIRAVLLDVYGTLLVSGSGDVGTAAEGRGAALVAALQAVGFDAAFDDEQAAALLPAAVGERHERAHRAGIAFPEVDIAEVWRDIVRGLIARAALPPDAAAADYRRLAVEYELRANPVWPMPGLLELFAGLRAAGVQSGIISNAQFFTPPLFPALLDRTLEELGCAPALQFYSYRYGRAKPGAFLYALARGELARRRVAAVQTLYVGNDMLNDVGPAQRTGFRTALFAGDARSLRRREDDPRVAGVQPDAVVTNLPALLECLA